MKGDKLTVTVANAGACQRAANAIRANYERLVIMTRRYPVMIDFADHRIVLEKPADIDEAIVAIDLKVSAALGASSPAGPAGFPLGYPLFNPSVRDAALWERKRGRGLK